MRHQEDRWVLSAPGRHALIRVTATDSQNGFSRMFRAHSVVSLLGASGSIEHQHLRHSVDLAQATWSNGFAAVPGMCEWSQERSVGTLKARGSTASWELKFLSPLNVTPLVCGVAGIKLPSRDLRAAIYTLGESSRVVVANQESSFSGGNGTYVGLVGRTAPQRDLEISVAHPDFSCVTKSFGRPRLVTYLTRTEGSESTHSNLWECLRVKESLAKDRWDAELVRGPLRYRVELRVIKKLGYQLTGENADGSPLFLSVFPFCETEVHVYRGTKLQTTLRLGQVGTLCSTEAHQDPYATVLR